MPSRMLPACQCRGNMPVKVYSKRNLIVWPLFLSALLSACGTGYQAKYLAKSDVSFVADTHLKRMERQLRKMTTKLYRRNPNQLARGPGISIEQRVGEIFDQPGELVFKELYEHRGIDAMNLAFNPNYDGDRVFALMAGMTDMIRASYNYKTEFFILDSLDEQKLYDSARNIEIAVWRLHNSRDSAGNLLILADSSATETRNLSYERLFGKMIATQDNLAEIIAQKTHRTITRVVHNVASMAFLPI